jgi:hypothetical protein
MLGPLQRSMASLQPLYLYLVVHPALTSGRLRWAWVLGRYRFRRAWSTLLDNPWGRWWQVLAAILPGGVGLVTTYGKCWPTSAQAVSVVTLLLAVAVLQLYGQARNNRDRIKTQNQFADLFGEITKGSDSAEQGRIAAELGRVESEKGRIEAEQGRIKLSKQIELGRIEAEQGRIEEQVSRSKQTDLIIALITAFKQDTN